MTEHTCADCGHGFTADGDADVHCPKCGGPASERRVVENALADIEHAADNVDAEGLRYDAEMIRENVATIREALGDE